MLPIPPFSSPGGWGPRSIPCSEFPEGPACSQPGWPYLCSPSAHSWLDSRRSTRKWLQIVSAPQECAKQALCSCLSADPGSQPGQWGTVAPLTWFRSHLTAQIYRCEPRKTLTCPRHRGRDWQAKPGQHRGVGWCLMAHSCWAIRNIGISPFRDTLSFPYLFLKIPTGLRCTPDTCPSEKGGLAIIRCAGQLPSSHIYFWKP